MKRVIAFVMAALASVLVGILCLPVSGSHIPDIIFAHAGVIIIAVWAVAFIVASWKPVRRKYKRVHKMSRRLLKQKLFGLAFVLAGSGILALCYYASPSDHGTKDGTGGILMILAGVCLLRAKKVYI